VSSKPRYINSYTKHQNSYIVTPKNSCFSPGQATCKQDLQSRFLLLWPWPDDLDIRNWPRYSEDGSAHQKWSCGSKLCSNRTNRCNWTSHLQCV